MAATTAHRLVTAAASTNDTLVRAGVTQMHFVTGYNANAAVRYLKFYDKATAPTVGTDVPVLTFALAPSAAFSFMFPDKFQFQLGLGFGMATGSADNSTAALTANDVVGLNIAYG